MSAVRLAGLVCMLAALGVTRSSAGSQGDFGDAAAIIQFQRSVDSYAFVHRQVQRRLGEGADELAMAAGMHAARQSAADGDFFTSTIAAAFHHRIATALKRPGCAVVPAGTASSEVPRVGFLTIRTSSLPECVLGFLPRLPEELAYRQVGVVMVLLDTHANMVIDILHGAFPPAGER
jgi:hypothetical protein